MADLLTLIVKFRNKEYTLTCSKFIPSVLNIKIGLEQKKKKLPHIQLIAFNENYMTNF